MRQIRSTRTAPTIATLPPTVLSNSNPPGNYPWALWLRANDILQANGSTVATWTDQGSGRTSATYGGSTITLATSQVNGKSAVRFPGGSESMACARTAAAKPLTIIAVVRVDALSGNQTILGCATTAGPRQFRVQADGKIDLVKANTVQVGQSTGSISAATYTIVTVTYDASGNYAFYINGAASGSGTNSQTFTANTSLIGAKTGGEVLTGHIAELMEADAALTSTQLALAHADLGAFYGIAV